VKKETLSIFVDESGDFGAFAKHSPYYIVTLVLHDQSVPLREEIDKLERRIQEKGFVHHAIHTGPLIRREAIYENETREKRRSLFNTLVPFTRKIDIRYISVLIEKKECRDEITLAAKISRKLSATLQTKMAFFNEFDRIFVYYDNGQIELTKILVSVFNALFSNVEFRKVRPIDYTLFQVADLFCTLELLAKKMEQKNFSQSEEEFFCSTREFKKDYLKPLRKKQL